MRKLLRLLLSGMLLMLFAGIGNAQTVLRNPEVSVGQLIKVIPSLKDYQTPPGFVPPISRVRDRVLGINEDNEDIQRTQYKNANVTDPVVQQYASGQNSGSNFANPNPLPNTFTGGVITQNFAGMGYTSVSPADPNMCAGPNHVIQMINGGAGSYLKVWDRNGTQVIAQIYITNLIPTAGYSGSGDPIAIYDPIADRYMLTEFARIGGSNINSLCIMVSQTNDPTGAWYVYKFTDVSFFPDYPHYGVWPNALYASTNDFNAAGSAYLGSSVWAFDKTKMLAGNPTATVQRFRLNFLCAPVNISNGSAAPTTTGTVGHFMYYNDDAFNPNAGAVDSIGMMNFTPDFTTPANTTLTYAQSMVTAPFQTGFCGGRNCVPSASGNGYDGLADRIMNRVNYRNFGGYESMVLNYTVNANAGTGQPAKAGIRWYELRKNPGGAWSIYQQSTYAPDNDWRWMGSININSKGQIALGYNRSGTTSYASIVFAGRNSGDALNTMSVAEVVAKPGTAYGTFGNRWGDYNEVTVDKVNDSLFWMTAMYGNTASQWATQVVQFKLGDCDVLSSTQNNVTQTGAAGVPEQQNITYTNTINNNGCTAIANYLITDTLPTNVTFQSATNGGTYNAGNRVVSWPVNLNPGQVGTYQVTVKSNAGSYFPTTTSINEPVAGAGIPAGWTATTATGPSNWVSSTNTSHSAPNSLYAVDNATAITDFRVTMNAAVATGATPPTLTFWHNYTCETGWDGGVVEMSTNGGTTWTDLGSYMTVNGYSGSVANNNPMSGRAAFTGTSNGWLQTKLRLLPTGQNAMFRFRMGSDDNTAYPATNPGWYVDDILMQNIAEVNIRSSYFNSSGTRLSYKDTFTVILPPVVGCNPPSITSNPSNVSTCAASNASFAVTATGDPTLTYQWQESTNGGGTWNNVVNGGVYGGATTTTLALTGVTAGMNNYQYRCIVTSSTCAPPATSNVAILTVAAASVGGTINPALIPVCGTTNSGTFTLSGHTGNVIRWEFSTVGAGGPWTTIANTTTTYTFTNITQTTWYRAIVQFPGCVAVNSSVSQASFTASNPMSIQSDAGTVLCQGDPARLTAVDGGGIQSFTSAGGLTIPSSGTASPYPLPLVVSGLPAGATVQSVVITNMNHTWTGDIDVAITGPTFVAGGSIQAVMLLSDLGNDANDDAVNTTITFVDGAPRVPNQNPIPSGTYSCTNDGAVNDIMPNPGPNLNVAAPLLTALNTATMNGTWNLWVNDQVGGDAGNIASYTINFTTPTSPITTGTFLWSPATGLNSTTTNPVAASPAVTTTYTVLHNNGAGCIRQANITLTVNTRPGVSTQPANTTVCAGSAATFTAVATGTGATYQWQESTNGGVTWVSLTNGAPYSGVTTGTLTINPVTVAMNGYRYRLAVSGTCPPVANSNGAILTVNALPVVTINPAGPVCGGVAGTNGVALTASGASTYTWAPFTGLYTNATATTAYAGGNANPVYAAPTVFTTYTVSGTDAGTGCVGTAKVIVNYTPPPPTVTPNPVVMCLGDPAVKLKSSSSTSTTVQFCSGPISVPIPDNNPAGAISNITVSGIPAACNVTGLAATWNLTHTWNGDMVIALKAPNGQILNLDYYLSGTGGAGATTGFVNTKVSSTGVNALSTGTGTYTGTFRADAIINGAGGSGGPTGYTPTTNTWTPLYSTGNGVYTLAMYDGGALDVGTLTSWCLDVTYTCGVPSTPAVWSPIGGLFSDANATIPYVANTPVDSVWTRPTPAGVYNYNVTVQSLPTPPAAVTTPMTGGNGNNMVFFNLTNTNGYAMTLTGISTNAFNSGTATAVNMYYKTSAIAGNPGLINAGNGWNIAPGATATNVAVTGNVLNPVLSAINLTIPAGATYGIGLEFTGAATFPAYTNGDGTIDNYTNNGVTISVDGNIGWGGPVAPGPPANNPRNFNGAVYLTAGNVPPCTSPARVVTVTVNTQPTVTIQPVNQTICTDKVATFTVAATIPLGAIAYQWEVSTNGGNTYSAITNGGVYSGATTPTLTITAPPVSMSGYYYRCRLQGPAPCTPAYSFFRILTVNPLPTVVISASPYVKLFPGLVTTISSTVSPFAAAQYVWRRDGVIVGGANTGTISVDVDKLGEYQLTVTDVNGCVNSSNKITISDSVSTNCFLYPNPSAGRFQVRYYSVNNNSVLPRSVTVYDGKGVRVLTQYFGITAPYARMDLDLRPYGKGVYWVEIGDRNGSRLVICRAVVE